MTVIIDLPPEQLSALSVKAQSEGLSVEECAGRLLEEALKVRPDNRPLTERIRQIWADMPDSVRATLPTDGASQHDHYIYGVPKREW